ncbi:MAG: PQQ-dependent sugar dehydrogenase [Phycisphaerae bacterium]
MTRRRIIIALSSLFLGTAAFAQNHPPQAPTITEPAFDGRIVNAEDVHMETAPFSDPDAGQTHFCSDWEIWTVTPVERVWSRLCATGLERVHIHLGDGTFENSHLGRLSLLPDTDYRLRVRHRDDSGDPLTQWSAWSERFFRTGPPSTVFPLEMVDVATTPTPDWVDAFGFAIDLPFSTPAASLRLEAPDSSLLVEWSASVAPGNVLSNAGPLAAHVAVRVRVTAGASGLALPESEVRLTDDDGLSHSIYLPSIGLPAQQEIVFWVSSNGSTYYGLPTQTQPAFTVLARSAPAPWAVAPGFRVDVVATGFQLPVNIAFVPNPDPGPAAPIYYVSELYGKIKVVRRDGVIGTYASNLLDFNPTGAFPGSGEQGLTGLAVEPNSGDLFAALLYDAAPPNGPHFPKVVRFSSLDGGLTAAAQSPVLDMVNEPQGQSHQISNLTIGPDGKLYVHMGDGFATSTAQDLSSFRGKILRLNFDGSPAAGNPFYNLGDGITARDYVFCYGLRNPFGGAWRDADAGHYIVENGPSIDRFARAPSGRNFLWDGSDASMLNFALFNWSPAVAPVNLVFVQASQFAGSGFPSGRMGNAFVSESGPTWASGPQSLGKRITEITLSPGGSVLVGPTPLVTYNGSGKATCAGLAAGPDGLYFTDLYKDQNYTSPIDVGANVLRLRYVGEANFTANVVAGQAPLNVQFTDTSTVPGATAWNWDFGDSATSASQHPAHTYAADGVYNVRLAVTGAGGVVAVQKNAFIRVGTIRRIGFITSINPPSGTDAQIADYLRLRGFDVTTYDDDPGSRPSAVVIASAVDVVLISSTITSGNVGAEFNGVNVPLIFWEQGLLRLGREALANDGYVAANQTTIRIVNSTHPITRGLAGDVSVFSTPANMSLARGAIAGDAAVLATRPGAPGEPAILVVEPGALLLDGQVAPAKRVFLFLEDASWLNTTPEGRMLFERSIDWMFPSTACPGDLTGDRTVNESDLGLLLSGWQLNGSGDLDGDNDTDESDLGILLANWQVSCP